MLKNRVILITGANAGIGYASVQAMLDNGAKVILHGRNESALESALEQLDHPNADYVCGDLKDPAQYENIITNAAKKFNHLDGLVNNAGIFPRNNINNITQQDFDDIMTVNSRAPLFLTHYFVKSCQQNNIPSASVVNIGSVNAHCGQNDLLIYSMSKGAIQTMTRNLADGLSEYGIRINQINVGWTHTDTEHETQLNEGRPADWFNRIPKAAAPFGKILSPEQVAQHVVFWLSALSYPVSGQTYECEQYPLIGRNRLNETNI